MPETGRYAYPGLDRLLHEPARLGILTALITRAEGLTFGGLQAACGLTDGNLASHARHLEEAGLVTCRKCLDAGRSATLYQITPEGQTRFVEYLGVLKRVIRDASVEPSPRSRRARPA